MSVRRILVEKTVLILGKWDVNRVNEDVVRLIDIDSREKKGKKIRLQLTTEGLQVARGMFQESQPNDFTPIAIVLNIISGTYGPLNVMCFTRGNTTNYSVVVYTCTTKYDCAEFVDNYRRLRRGVTVDGDNFDLRPIDDTNWSLGLPLKPEPQGLVYIQKSQRLPISKAKLIVPPPAPIYDQARTLKRSEHREHNLTVQNGNGHSQTYSDSGIVTNGTVSSEKPRNKPKRSKSFKLFDSLKGKSKRDPSPRREKKVTNDKKYQTNGKPNGDVTPINGVQHQPTPVEQDLSNAELRENLQHVSEELKNIKLLLVNNPGVVPDSENVTPSGRIYQKNSTGGETRVITQKHSSSYATSDSEALPTTRMRIPSDKGKFKSNSMSRNQPSRNGEIKTSMPEHRFPVGYVVKRPVRVSHGHGPPPTDVPIHVHTHRTRAYSNGMDPRNAPHHGVEVHLGPTHSTSSSMTLPRSYKPDPSLSPGNKNAPRVTFDETATEGPSRWNSTRSAARLVNHGPRASDTVVKPIEKVYANPNVYYGQPRSVVISPGGRPGANSAHKYRHSAHDREYIPNERRNGTLQEMGL